MLHYVSHAEHDNSVANDQYALTVVLARKHLRGAAQPQNDVAPAFSTRRTMIKLAEQAAELSLIGEVLSDSNCGQPIQNSELFLAEPLVDDE